jgi:uncharacterized NAD-dependent epimerase/dehydratase family protein
VNRIDPTDNDIVQLLAQSRPIGVPILGAQSSASQTANYQPIPPTDKRYGMYYHLCALFPESKVRAVILNTKKLQFTTVKSKMTKYGLKLTRKCQ